MDKYVEKFTLRLDEFHFHVYSNFLASLSCTPKMTRGQKPYNSVSKVVQRMKVAHRERQTVGRSFHWD